MTALTHEDGCFDVAHCGDVLMHVLDAQVVPREVNRVVKPGGIIAAREVIADASFARPDFDLLRQAWDSFGDLSAVDKVHPQKGMDVKAHFVEVGLTSFRVSASIETSTTASELACIHHFAHQWFLASKIRDSAIWNGEATPALCHQIGYGKWKDHPGAVAAVASGDLVAWKPASSPLSDFSNRKGCDPRPSQGCKNSES
ncbi:MAG: methyltransferase domain-containing protein [Chloroflexi bacterium]|nr:methyltransferase domain-containing protein [Chloroflexota bacterium]MCY3957135.1 methyltransferase domain-containing protein [Chloroflexota bacterium]